VPDDLVKGLRALKNQRPSEARLALIAAPFGLSDAASAQAAGSTSTTAAAAPSSSGALIAKILGVTLAAGGIGLVGWLALSGRGATPTERTDVRDPVSAAAPPEPPAPSALPGSAERLAPPPAGAETALPPATQPDVPERSAHSPNAIPMAPAAASPPATRRDTPSAPRLEPQARAATASTPPNRSTTTYERPAAASSETQLSETQLLAQARSAEPARALALAEEHARRFPASALAQEREFVIITALLRAGNRSAAEQRARQFARSYPKSPYLARLQSLLPNALEAQ
jgi:hypothetical protein